MSTILVWIEEQGGAFTPSSLGLLGKAKDVASQLGGEAVAVVTGDGVASRASGLGGYGASRVLAAEGSQFSDPVPEPLVAALEAAIAQTSPAAIFLSATVLGAEVAGRLAARAGLGVNNDAVDARAENGAVIVRKPALEDSVYVDCGWRDDCGIALFRANAFPPTSANGASAEVATLEVGDVSAAVEFLGREQAATGGVDITEADILVGAGRGLGGPDKFGIVESLAKTLGGEVATTRAVVDAGWYDYATQVGQTGKTVAPKLYVAVGISGAIQHKVGMQSSGTIVAINKDPNAPIFEFADFGIVGDLFEIVPKLEQEIAKRKG